MAEADYVDALFNNTTGARSVLDLGCGTGRRDRVHRERLHRGWRRPQPGDDNEGLRSREQLLPHIRERLTFDHCAIRDLRLGRRFDAVVSLFHVISYQVSTTI